MHHATISRLFALVAVLAATACTPVFAAKDQAGLSPVTFGQPASTVVGQR